MSTSTTSESRRVRQRLAGECSQLATLADALWACMPPECGDVVEFSLDTTGRQGVLLYPRRRRSFECFGDLFEGAGLEREGRVVLGQMLRRVPAERHAVRLLGDRSVSIFFKVDVPVSGIRQLLTAFDVWEANRTVEAFFAGRSQPPCGFAVEFGQRGFDRIRFYGMVLAPTELQAALSFADAYFGWTSSSTLYDFLQCSSSSTSEVVVNLAAANYGSSIKFEIPKIPVEASPSLLSAESDLWRRSRALSRSLRADCFPYVGIRSGTDGTRCLTCYIDASGAVLGLPHEPTSSQERTILKQEHAGVDLS